MCYNLKFSQLRLVAEHQQEPGNVRHDIIGNIFIHETHLLLKIIYIYMINECFLMFDVLCIENNILKNHKILEG